MSPAGRPKVYPVKKLIGFEQQMIDAIDAWREKQKPALTQSDAIRRLVELGLKKGNR
jgi:hypothetical protein